MTASASDHFSRRLTRRYVVALTAIAVLAIAGQALVQVSLHSQAADGREVNLAGRQRMLSQRIAKHALAAVAGVEHDRHLAEMKADVGDWARVHQGLLHGDPVLGLPGIGDAAVRASLDSLSGLVHEAVTASHTLRSSLLAGNTAGAGRALDALLAAEHAFLPAMDRVVFRLDAGARSAVHGLRWIEGTLLLLTLVVLAGEARFVFRPAVQHAAESMEQAASQDLLLRTVVDTIPDPIFALDRDERYVLSNRAHAQMLGFEHPEEVLALTSRDTASREVPAT